MPHNNLQAVTISNEGKMQAQDFAEFVARQQNAADDARVDWIQVREEWLRDLESLYNRIVDFLKEFVAKGSIRHSFVDVTVTEEGIGTYNAKGMNIDIGRKHVFLEPVGTLLIGSRGRVDVIGPVGRAQLMLVDARARRAADLIKVTVTVAPKEGGGPPAPPPEKESILAWKIIVREPRGTFLDLDRDSFFDLLVEIAGA
jgi:hypothetical protein